MSALRRYHLRIPSMLVRVLVLMAAVGGLAGASPIRTPAPATVGGTSATGNYVVANITYSLDQQDPGNIAAVTFTITPDTAVTPATVVQAKLVQSSRSYSICTKVGADSSTWTCSFSGVTVRMVDELSVRLATPQSAPQPGIWLPVIRTNGSTTFLPCVSR